MGDERSICVLGAGIVGLTTALMVRQRYTDWNVTIVADKFDEETLSHVAAGIFRPSTAFRGPTPDITKQWLVDAYHHYREIQESTESGQAGVMEVSGYVLSSKYPEVSRNKFLEDLLPDYRQATPAELKICPGDWKYGAFFTTLVIDSTYHLPWLRQKFEGLGGKIVRKTITSFDQLDEFDLVVNCTGFAAKQLCGDDRLVPVRGQVFKVRAPWIKMFFYGDYDTYVVPGVSHVTLGGCRNYDSFRETVDQHDSASIWERCTDLVPNLHGAQVLCESVGLRPHRDPVRVEKDVHVTATGRYLPIVHHYGHGGYGIMTAPGTSKYALQLIKESFEQQRPPSIVAKL